MSKKEKMNPTLKRIFIGVMITGLLGSIIHGFFAVFVLGVDSQVGGYIIGYGSALTAAIGGVVISIFNANEKKGDGKN